MKRILVNIVIYAEKIPNITELLPHETEIVGKWKADGILESSLLKEDKTGIFLIFKDIELDKLKEILATLPLYPYFESVDYSILSKQF